MSKSYTVYLEEDQNTSDLILPLPPELLEEVGWKEGDTINWHDNKDGTFTMSNKIETELVLVEAISTFRMRYMVEVPKGKAEWALDTVTLEEAKEFSQEHIGENIISYRVVSEDYAITLCDIDNEYSAAWSNEKKIEAFVTPWKEEVTEEHSDAWYDTDRNR